MAVNPSFVPVCPRIDWSNTKNLADEYNTFEEMVNLMRIGPLKDVSDPEMFGYVKLWTVPKSIELWKNSGKTVANVKNLLEVLKDYCIPSDRRFWSARMEFRQLSQRNGESIQDFSNRVMSLATTCEWASKEEQIVCTIIFGASHVDAQHKALLKDKTLTVKECIEHFASYEATDLYHKTIKSNHMHVNQVLRACYNCGRKHERGQCRAYGHSCRKCGKANHYEAVCMTKSQPINNSQNIPKNTNNKGGNSSSKNKSNSRKSFKKKVNHVENESQDSDDEEVFYVNRVVNNSQTNDNSVKLRFDESKIGILAQVDTGAGVSVIPHRVYLKVFPHIPIINTNTKLSAYNNTPIDVMGKIYVSCKYGDNTKKLKFIVTGHSTSTIIGSPDAVNLGCVKFCSNPTSVKDCVKKVSISKKGELTLPLGKSGDPKAEILEHYPELFKGIGCVKTMYKIELLKDAIPVRHASRRVPEAIRPKVKLELDRLVEEGIIKPVDAPTEWVNSLVVATKPDGSLRLCLDPKDLNKYIKRPLYFSPTIDDILPQLCGSKFFSTLDARSGYWNVPLCNKSQLLTTFNTPGYGRFCFVRLPFGLVSSQDLFQRVMDDILSDIPNATPVADDIKIHGRTEAEHDATLIRVLNKCQSAGLHLNPDKCQIKQQSVKFYGNMLTVDGLQPDKTKIRAILNMSPPTNKQELRSLMGMVNYLTRFIPNTSALLEPLRLLLKDNAHFNWESAQDASLHQIKEAITSPSSLQYFNHTAPTEVQCDASLKGLGACLIQNDRPISYASKSLSDAEKRYSNIEREMLGVVYALTKFHQYTYGRRITVITDHKPLESLRKKNINDCPARLQRMFLRIQAYDYTIVYRAGSKIPIPDCLSRCISSRAGRHLPGMNVQVNNISLTHASKLDEVREHLQKDDDLLQLRDMTLSGWPSDRSHVPASLLAYWPYKDELAYYSGVLLKGSRIIIPSSLRSAVLKDIHRGHLGIEKCRLRARRYVFWPNMNIDISSVVHACEICQSHAAPQPKQYTYTMTDENHRPMQTVGADIFQYNGETFLILIDYFSKYPWVRRLRNISATTTIDAMRTVFSEFGYPSHLHSDYGTQFTAR